MPEYPQTLEEARAYRYNEWAGNPNGSSYLVGWCAYEVFRTLPGHQCYRKDGYGPERLYCKQHAKIVQEQV